MHRNDYEIIVKNLESTISMFLSSLSLHPKTSSITIHVDTVKQLVLDLEQAQTYIETFHITA